MNNVTLLLHVCDKIKLLHALYGYVPIRFQCLMIVCTFKCHKIKVFLRIKTKEIMLLIIICYS